MSGWAALHTIKRHGGCVEGVAILEIAVPRRRLRRSKKGLWYGPRDIPNATGQRRGSPAPSLPPSHPLAGAALLLRGPLLDRPRGDHKRIAQIDPAEPRVARAQLVAAPGQLHRQRVHRPARPASRPRHGFRARWRRRSFNAAEVRDPGFRRRARQGRQVGAARKGGGQLGQPRGRRQPRRLNLAAVSRHPLRS